MSSVIKASEKLKKMREIVRADLEHIPRFGIDQNLFRQMYAAVRMNSLGSKARLPDSKSDVLRECIKYYKKEKPDFKPKFDEKYFGVRER
jgi:ubiquinone biosynthesis protein COQ9